MAWKNVAMGMAALVGGVIGGVFNSGQVVASIGADAETKGGRLSLARPSGGGCFVGLGLAGGGRLDLYHPQEAPPRVVLGIRDTRAGFLVLRDDQGSLDDIQKKAPLPSGDQIKQKPK